MDAHRGPVVKQDQFILILGPISNLRVYNMIRKGPFRSLGGDKMMNLVIHIIAGHLRSVAQKRGVAANHKGTNLRKGLVPTDLEWNQFSSNSSSFDEFKTKVGWNQLWSPPKTWVFPTVIAKSIYKPSFFTRTKAKRLPWWSAPLESWVVLQSTISLDVASPLHPEGKTFFWKKWWKLEDLHRFKWICGLQALVLWDKFVRSCPSESAKNASEKQHAKSSAEGP